MANQGIAAMFGPISSLTSAHVQSMCNAFEIPHLQWHWDARDTRDYYSISLYPHYLTLSMAYRDVVKYWGWDQFTVLYEDNDGQSSTNKKKKKKHQHIFIISYGETISRSCRNVTRHYMYKLHVT
jgi:hypothetical protein